MKKASLLKRFALCMAFQAAALPAALAQEPPPEPARASRYASVVINAADGQTIYERGADRRLRPASTTKIMTAYLTFEALRDGTLRLDQELTVSRHAASQQRTNLAMIRPVTITDRRTGRKRTEQRQVIQTITVEDALKGMLVHSANDAAVVLAEAIGSNVAGFADRMNAAAARLGMNDSHFMNPNGLPHTQQYTTVADMARLSAAVIAEYPEYYHFFGLRTFRYNGTNYRNYNNLLGSYDGVDGLKTGYIHTSGFNLAASATRDGQRIVAVVFGADNSAQRRADMTVLLDYGFAVLASQPRPTPQTNDNDTPADREAPEDAAPGFRFGAAGKAPAFGAGFLTASAQFSTAARATWARTGTQTAATSFPPCNIRARVGINRAPIAPAPPLPERKKQPLYASRFPPVRPRGP